MPRRSSGPKLWFDKKRETWTIIDGRRRSRTGLGASEIGAAEKSLRDYIAEKHQPASGPDPLIGDVLTVYQDEHLINAVAEKHILYDIGHLTRWWGTKRVSEINAASCRAYIAHRNAGASARRELSFLTAAMRFWRKERAPLMVVPALTLPPKSEPRQHFMERDEAAAFLWKARRTPHIARFFIIGWYTGSRRAAIMGLRWPMVDLKNRHHDAQGTRRTGNQETRPAYQDGRSIDGAPSTLETD
jgi:integrase